MQMAPTDSRNMISIAIGIAGSMPRLARLLNRLYSGLLQTLY